MKIWIGLLTPNKDLRDYFGRKKSSIIPQASIGRGIYAEKNPTFFTTSYIPEQKASKGDFERFVLRECADADICIILADVEWEFCVTDCANALFVVRFSSDEVGGNPQNFFQRIIASVLRIYAQLAVKLANLSDFKLLALPLRNFHADELREIARLCREPPLDGTFINAIEASLTRLRARVRPRKRSSHKTTYAVDDRRRFFSYGFEHHAQPETGGDHLPSCEIAAKFRFGWRLESQKHYNVSETEGDDTTLAGNFGNCHGEFQDEKRETHLNMFPSDAYF